MINQCIGIINRRLKLISWNDANRLEVLTLINHGLCMDDSSNVKVWLKRAKDK